MSVRKNISQIVSRLLLTFDLLHSIDHPRQSKSTLERETMIHLKSSRLRLCEHEALLDEVGVRIGAESLLKVRKFELLARERGPN